MGVVSDRPGTSVMPFAVQMLLSHIRNQRTLPLLRVLHQPPQHIERLHRRQRVELQFA